MTAQTIFILVHSGKQHSCPVAGADSAHISLRGPNRRRRRERNHLIRAVRAMAIHASSMTITVQDPSFSSVMKIRSRGRRMAYLRHLRHHIRSRRRHQRSAVVTRHAILGRGVKAGRGGRCRAQQPRRRGGIMIRMARGACIKSHRAVNANVRIRRRLIRSSLMNAVRPACKRIGLTCQHAVRIMTRQTHLSAGAIAD